MPRLENNHNRAVMVRAALLIILRNLRLRRWRTSLTLLGIVLGVAVILATQITNQTTLDSLRRVFDRASGRANLIVIPSSKDGDYLSEDLLSKVQRMRGIELATPSLHVRTLLADEVDSWQISFAMGGIASGNKFFLYGIDPKVDTQVRVYQLAQGRLPESNRYEVAIPAEFAKDKDLQIGNFLELLSQDQVVKLKIVGLLSNEGVALFNSGVVGFAPLKIVQDSFDRTSQYDEIALVLDKEIAEAPIQLELLKGQLSAAIKSEGDVIYASGRGQLVSQMLATYQLGLLLFSFLSLFVGAFLIYNTFAMTVAERSREIGMLRAIGMSQAQVIEVVLFEALLYSLVGSALGILAGIFLARGLTSIVADVITPTRGLLSITTLGLVQSLGVGIGVTLIAAYVPALQAAHISPLEALRARSRTQQRLKSFVWIGGLIMIVVGYILIYYVKWPDEIVFPVGSLALMLILLGATMTVTIAYQSLERFGRPLVGLLYRREGQVGSANIRRAVSRTTLTVAAFMVALTMIISISSVSNSFQEDIGVWVDNALGGDLYVRSAVAMRLSFASNLLNVPGVEHVTPTRIIDVRAAKSSLPAEVSEDRFYFNAIDIPTFRQITDFEFSANQGNPEAMWQELSRNRAIFVSNVTADRYHLKKGDALTLLTRRGEEKLKVAGIVIDFTGQSGLIYGTYHDLIDLFGEQGVDRFTLKVKGGFLIKDVAENIKERYQKRRHINVQTTQDFKESILSLVERSFRLFDVLSLIGIIIGGMGVVNTLTMNVIERQQEIGALRSFGMTRNQVTRMVMAEALSLGMMGAVYGIFFGYVLAHVMVYAMNIMVGYDLSYRFTVTPFLIGIILALVVSQVAAFYPARRASGLNIVEAIKHE